MKIELPFAHGQQETQSVIQVKISPERSVETFRSCKSLSSNYKTYGQQMTRVIHSICLGVSRSSSEQAAKQSSFELFSTIANISVF